MSDLLSELDDHPFRAHRCTPPAGKPGARWRCACGATLRFATEPFAQWLPVPARLPNPPGSKAPSRARHHTGR